MNSQRITLKPSLLTVTLALILLPACAPATPATPFIPPRAATPTQPGLQGNTPVIPTVTQQPIATASPTATPPCIDGLAFVEDLTIPDNTVVAPGSSVDKQWQVQNNGSCNWDSRYRLKFVGGVEMGAPIEQALYPARAGALAVIRITFTAPDQSGTYTTAWQAIDPFGEPFGDPVFMKIIVDENEVTIEVVQ